MRRLAAILAFLAVLGACGGEPSGVRLSFPSPTPTGPPPAPTEAGPPPPTRTTDATVTLVAVGDLMLGRSVGARLAAGEAGVPFAAVAHLLEGDLTVGNLEAPVAAGGEPQAKAYTFLAPPAAAAALAGAGFDVLALANNHALDYGPHALLETLTRLRAEGILPVGAGPDAERARAPAIVERNGLRLAFLAYVGTPPEGSYRRATWEAAPGRPGVAWLDLAAVREDVARAKAAADHVVVLFHFGSEGSAMPTAEQRAAVRAAFDAGATVVLGSHPHVLQPVETEDGRLAAYSLGNFVFDGFDGAANRSAVLRIVLGREGVRRWELLPVEVVDGLPRPAAGGGR